MLNAWYKKLFHIPQPYRCHSVTQYLRLQWHRSLKRQAFPCPICSRAHRLWSLCGQCMEEYVHPISSICHTCALPLPRYSRFCADCARRKTYFRTTISGFPYSFPTDRLILEVKNQGKLCWTPLIAELIWQQAHQHPHWNSPQNYKLIPIPSQANRLQQRGFNVPREICRTLTLLSGYPTLQQCLKKADSTRKQSQLNQHQRLQHYQDIFYCVYPEKVRQQRCIIVDDIMTTGSTANAAAETLLRAGAQSVDIWVGARTLHRYPALPISIEN